ncbi:hypothetical protein [Streptomyces sp. NBC_00987]|uniref:hypothetical protein n=1 Tax=Streptomyces sp. NBC_00987 TaxID=2903703 RepID=UPI003863ED8E|nr:hypothetical protein OG355_41120 [Streptomyces sp. NBC_00987]
MAVVSTCTYDSQGRLVRPDRLDIGRAKICLDLDTGESPTFDRDRTHVFVVSDSGVTPEHAHERVNERLRRFLDRAEAVRGFRKITMDKSQSANGLNHNTTISYEILYVVESAERSFGGSPEFPNGGYQQGWRAITPG